MRKQVTIQLINCWKPNLQVALTTICYLISQNVRRSHTIYMFIFHLHPMADENGHRFSYILYYVGLKTVWIDAIWPYINSELELTLALCYPSPPTLKPYKNACDIDYLVNKVWYHSIVRLHSLTSIFLESQYSMLFSWQVLTQILWESRLMSRTRLVEFNHSRK